MKIQEYWAQDWYRRLLWSPVLLGLGIGIYFYLNDEPPIILTFLALIVSIIFLYFQKWRAFPFFMIVFGFFLIHFKTFMLSTELIKAPEYSVILEGKITQLETLPSNEKKIILDLKDGRKVRLKVKGEKDLEIGYVIKGTGHLFPFSSPILQGTYHFRRQAFFQNLSAQGVINGKNIEVTEGKQEFSFRKMLTESIYAAIPGEKGAIIAALITGEKTKISKEVRDDYNNSGLSHILAISGLHVGLVAGFVFFLLRGGLALIPFVALRFNTKKIAAVLCIPILFFYMTISGFGTPVIRSFLMTTVVLFGIMVDRISISMNLVAIAAFAVLCIFPEALIHPSFQLSFAAVFALIAVYESPWAKSLQQVQGPFKKIFFYLLVLALTSMIATLATFPLTIATFNRFTLHAIEANMIGVPLMGVWIMPLGVCALLLMPLGLEHLALVPMGWGISLLNYIAHEVGGWPGSNISVATPPLWALNMVLFSLLWMGIWRAKWRFWSFPMLIVGLYYFIVPFNQKPDLIFDASSRTWAFRDENRLLTYPDSKRKFDLELWLRALGGDKIETISKSDKRFYCTKQGCLIKGPKVYIQFSKYGKKRKKGIILSYNDRKMRGQGFITKREFIFKPAQKSMRPWN